MTWVPLSARLLKRVEVPVWLRFNPYILGSYRSNLTAGQCIASVFSIHNETGNIWTHMVPIFYFFSLWFRRGPWPGAPWTFAAATVPSMLCLACSVSYHTFMPLPSSKTYSTLLLVDYVSVLNVMIWPAFNLINYSLLCLPEICKYVIVSYLVVSAVMLYVAISANTVVKRLIPLGVLSAIRTALNIARNHVGQARCAY